MKKSRLPKLGGIKKSRSKSKKPAKAPNQNVNVCVRMRPLNRLEKRTNQVVAWHIDGNSIVQLYNPSKDGKKNSRHAKSKPRDNLVFDFDTIFEPHVNNDEVYSAIAQNVVEDCMSGYHGCVFAYGQTSAGKTYTIHGSGESPGIIPQAIDNIFRFIEENPDREFVLRVSYMEIYNEIVNDLLAPENTNLRVREDKKLGVFVEGLKEDVFVSEDQVYSLLHAGSSHRHVGRTNYNDISSRSHTVFRIVIESSPLGDAKGGVRTSALNLVDLAGSENAVKAGSAARLKETGYINKSLLTLGHVIYKLSEGNTEHVPYRDSKLTRILQTSLGGRARVAVCCNVSPSSGNLEETISTLKFAQRAKRIVNDARLNERLDGATLLKKYRQEIENLKTQLEAAQEAGLLLQQEKKEKAKVREEMQRNQQEKEHLEHKIATIRRLIVTSSVALPDEVMQIIGLAGSPVGKNHKKMTLRRAPAFMARRKSVENLSQIGRRSSITNLRSPAVDVDVATGVIEDDDQLCDDTTPSILKVESEDPDTLKEQIKELRRILQEKDDLLLRNQLDIRRLEAENEEKTQLLSEWDAYYVNNANKLDAFKENLRRKADESRNTEEVHTLLDNMELEDDWDAPLVDVVKERSDSRLEPQERKKFNDVMSRFKSMEQDL